MRKTARFTGLFIIGLLALNACQKKKGATLSVYPNPATSYIIFDATGSTKFKNGEIKVKDVLGNVIKSFRTEDSSHIQWQIDTFDRGLYHYSYTADKMREQTGKVVFN